MGVTQKQGHLEVSISGMIDILSIISEKPRVASNVLCPMILKYIPSYTGLTLEYIINFRKRVLLFLIKNTNYQELTYNQAIALSSRRMIAADEMSDLDDPSLFKTSRQCYGR